MALELKRPKEGWYTALLPFMTGNIRINIERNDFTDRYVVDIKLTDKNMNTFVFMYGAEFATIHLAKKAVERELQKVADRIYTILEE